MFDKSGDGGNITVEWTIFFKKLTRAAYSVKDRPRSVTEFVGARSQFHRLRRCEQRHGHHVSKHSDDVQGSHCRMRAETHYILIELFGW
jgi:hypothetical protein